MQGWESNSRRGDEEEVCSELFVDVDVDAVVAVVLMSIIESTLVNTLDGE